MSVLYLPQDVSQPELAKAVVEHMRKLVDAFEREYVCLEDMSFSVTVTAAKKLGVTCLPTVPAFDGERQTRASGTEQEVKRG